jgi:hypothetical protein
MNWNLGANENSTFSHGSSAETRRDMKLFYRIFLLKNASVSVGNKKNEKTVLQEERELELVLKESEPYQTFVISNEM